VPGSDVLSVPRIDGWRACVQALVGHGSPVSALPLRQTMNILGISAFYHDSAACLLRDGVIVAAAQEERFSRRKHDPDFPQQAIAFCLKQGGLSAPDLDPWRSTTSDPEVRAHPPNPSGGGTTGLAAFVEGRSPMAQGEALDPRPHSVEPVVSRTDSLSRTPRIPCGGGVLPFSYGEAAILTMDGVGEWATTSLGVGCGNRGPAPQRHRVPHSLGLLYSAFTHYCGFRINDGEYKLMGLAPYGKAVFVKRILEELIDVKADGSFRLNLAYFDYCGGLAMTNRRFEALFGGPAREPESALESAFWMRPAPSRRLRR